MYIYIRGGRGRIKGWKINACAKRTGLKRFYGIFAVFPLKVTVAIVLEKLSGASAGSCEAHKSRDGLSPSGIGEGCEVGGEGLDEKAGATSRYVIPTRDTRA